MTKTIIGYETTPYGVEQVNGLFVVMQTWWNKTVAGPFRSREEANQECERIARENGCYKRVKFRV